MREWEMTDDLEENDYFFGDSYQEGELVRGFCVFSDGTWNCGLFGDDAKPRQAFLSSEEFAYYANGIEFSAGYNLQDNVMMLKVVREGKEKSVFFVFSMGAWSYDSHLLDKRSLNYLLDQNQLALNGEVTVEPLCEVPTRFRFFFHGTEPLRPVPFPMECKERKSPGRQAILGNKEGNPLGLVMLRDGGKEWFGECFDGKPCGIGMGVERTEKGVAVHYGVFDPAEDPLAYPSFRKTDNLYRVEFTQKGKSSYAFYLAGKGSETEELRIGFLVEGPTIRFFATTKEGDAIAVAEDPSHEGKEIVLVHDALTDESKKQTL